MFPKKRSKLLPACCPPGTAPTGPSVTKDALAPVIRTNLDVYFGRLAAGPSVAGESPEMSEAALRLVRQVAANLLQSPDGEASVDPTVLRSVFTRGTAFPPWLLNKALATCKNDGSLLEKKILSLLRDTTNRRKFFDYLSGELLYHSWLWTKEDDRSRWSRSVINDLQYNRYCMQLNAVDCVLRLDHSFITKGISDDVSQSWYIKALGSVALVNIVSLSIREFAAQQLEARYKSLFLEKLFHKLFTMVSRGSELNQYGVFVLGDIPKFFILGDYLSTDPTAFPRGLGIVELYRRIVARFDNDSSRAHPEARFRLCGEPPQAIMNRIGAMFWLHKTLDAARKLEQKKAVPVYGMQVEDQTVLEEALKQKRVIYINLSDDPDSALISPCYLRELRGDFMRLQSSRGNRLNEAHVMQDVHGYFSIATNNKKTTYCDFDAKVLSVTDLDAESCLVKLSFPETFELTRRSHKRLSVDPAWIGVFEMSSPALDADWSRFDVLQQWPAPFCIIPDSESHCHIKDLSAGGFMLEIHEDAPAFGYFIEPNKDYPLLAMLHLVGRETVPDLKLGLRLEIKSIRDVQAVHRKYVGFQFTAAGEIRDDRLVRFAKVGKDGVFLIEDWIFRNSIGR